MATANVSAYGMGRTCASAHKSTPVPPPLRAAIHWGGQPEGCTSRDQPLLAHYTHTHTHTVPRGTNSSIWSLMWSGLVCFFSSFFSSHDWSGEGVYLRPLKDDRVEQDVMGAKQKLRWGISRQLKASSCKREGTPRRRFRGTKGP